MLFPNKGALLITGILAGLLTNPALSAEITDDERKAWLAENAIHERKVMVPMRDGVRLATDIIRPKDADRMPLFQRTFSTLSDRKYAGDGALRGLRRRTSDLMSGKVLLLGLAGTGSLLASVLAEYSREGMTVEREML